MMHVTANGGEAPAPRPGEGCAERQGGIRPSSGPAAARGCGLAVALGAAVRPQHAAATASFAKESIGSPLEDVLAGTEMLPATFGERATRGVVGGHRMGLNERLRWRYDFFMTARHFSLAERLAFVTPRIGARSLSDMLLRRLRVTEAGEPFFAIGADRIFFARDADAARAAEALEGALVVLAESYGGSGEFFSPPVDIAEGDVVLDLGGNIGTSALAFARKAGPSGRVFSFEPVFHEPLRRTAVESGAETVEVIASAVGDHVGEVEFEVTAKGIDSSLSGKHREFETLRVPMTTVDAFVAERGLDRVDFIKCDIEGAEELAIRGAQETIRRFRPKWTISSYHTDPEGDAQHPKLVALLSAAGYTVRTLGEHHIYAH